VGHVRLPRIQSSRLRAVPATARDAPKLQACLEAGEDYFLQTEGAPAGAGAAEQLLADAEADAMRGVFLLAPPAGGAPVGVLDLYLHHPEPGVAHVGLLLLRQAFRGRGLGRELVEALEETLGKSGFSALRLSVGDENPGARDFWERLGFEPAGRLDQAVTVYEKRLAALPPRGPRPAPGAP
jgi:ribosomal protein S18 acetylase RimI-like enzyme